MPPKYVRGGRETGERASSEWRCRPKLVSIKIDSDVLAYLQEDGSGWQDCMWHIARCDKGKALTLLYGAAQATPSGRCPLFFKAGNASVGLSILF
ncbi:BrnA antitoxin family protein [Rhizobium leguminosarum]|uniref:BrnA antitoxin family protein n=1 Tax=Rhizobium leguminosarum TaxID=384 RepID=UPI003D7C26E5